MSVARDSNPRFEQYSHPEHLVSTNWLAEHLDDPNVVVVESDEDVLLYDTGHIPGSVKIDWHMDLNDSLTRDYLDGDAFAELMATKGISRDTTVVFYGDNFNWWATYALWVFKLFGHQDVRLLDGGRRKWSTEGRDMTTDVPEPGSGQYPEVERDDTTVRAFRDDVFEHLKTEGRFVDVRSPGEFSGRLLHMPDYPQEGALRAGHIPGASNVPWKRATNPDGTFRPVNELRAIYLEELGFSSDDDVITYCRIGERSSHTWFVLSYLLGFERVRNYDGSWTEWGNLVGAPVER